jgi:hypothetical protein
MIYDDQDVKDIFARWCKAVGVKEAKPLPPIVNGQYSEPYEFIEGTYCIPKGISGWGIAEYVSDNGGINVIIRTDTRYILAELMLFAIQCINIKAGKTK